MAKKRDSMAHKNQIIPILAFYLLITALSAWRVWHAVSQFFPGWALPWYAADCCVLSFSLPLGYLLPKTRIAKGLEIIGNYWYSLQFMLIFAALFEWLVDVVVVCLRRLPLQKQMSVFSLVIFVVAAAGFLYGAVHTRKIKIREYDCPVAKPLPTGETLRIVHLSDIHLGSINDLHMVQKIVSEVNTLSADYICITGDMFTETTHEVFEMNAISAEFRKLKSKYGVYACLGNHDAGEDLPEMKRFFQESGITLLEDESVVQEGVFLLGRTDMTPGGDTGHNRPSVQPV